MDALTPDEYDLRGNWLVEGKRVLADPVEQRIEWLIEHCLQRIANDWSG